jgi:hypothetical protein
MKVAKTFVYNEKQSMESNVRRLDQDAKQLFTALQGRVRFGSGTDGDRGENIAGEFQVATTAGADTEVAIPHSLGAAPIGYIILRQDKAGSVYDSGTTWTDTNIYIKCSTAATTLTLFLLK